MKKNRKRIVLFLIFAIAAMQFIQPERNNPVTPAEQDFAVVHNLSEADAQLIKAACYDCHSNEVVFPWYANVAPVSYFVAEHVEDGRKHLNFSIWSTYAEGKADHKLEECSEELEKGAMPLDSYVWLHKEADLSEEQRSGLIELFASLRK